jgi:ketosteroid isomerase-like protein
MPEGNLETARGVLDAFTNAGRDVPDLAALTDPEIEMDTTRFPVPGLAEVWRGRAEVSRFWQRWVDAWDTYGEFGDPEFIEAGDQVIVCFERHEMRGAGSGVAVPMPAYAWVWLMRDQKVLRATIYMDRAEALAAAGVEE